MLRCRGRRAVFFEVEAEWCAGHVTACIVRQTESLVGMVRVDVVLRWVRAITSNDADSWITGWSVQLLRLRESDRLNHASCCCV